MPSPSSRGLRRAQPWLGTIVEIVLPEAGAREEEATRAAFAEIAEVQRRMSFHDPASMLSRINREAAHVVVPVDEWTLAVLQAAAELHRISGGLFDITVAPQLQERGHLPGPRPVGPGGSFADVELVSGDGVRFRRPGMALDLGGIAKGFAVDRAVDALRGAGVAAGLVNAGGDLRAFGVEAFAVSIRNPDRPGETLVEVPVKDEALATSAHYFSEGMAEGATGPAIVFPPLIEPHPLPRSVTVRAPRALHADALTKVVMLDPEAAAPVLRHFGASAFFVSTDGELLCSEDWNATLHVST